MPTTPITVGHALEQRLTDPKMIEYTLTRFHEELQKRLAELLATHPLSYRNSPRWKEA
jgi:hypothetical protein